MIDKSIYFRILEIVKSSNKSKFNILNVNSTSFINYFPKKYFKNGQITVETFKEEYFNILEKINSVPDQKFDLIFTQFPLGIKKPNPNDLIYELAKQKLVDGGIILNISTFQSFDHKFQKKYFPFITRYRENILGQIYKPESGVNVSLYEYQKGPIDQLSNPFIEYCDLREFSENDNNLGNIRVGKTTHAYFYRAEISIAQEKQIKSFRDKKLDPHYLRDITSELSLIDLTKKVENKDEVIKQLSNFKNAIFIPTMPSNSNQVATNVQDLKPWRYWFLNFNPNKFLNTYIAEFLNSNEGKNQLISLSRGNIMPNLNMQALGRICVPLKKTQEQERIVSDRRKLQEAYIKLQERFKKLDDEVENSDFDFNIEELMKDFPDYTIKQYLSLEESKKFERKSSLRFDIKQNKIENFITNQVLKTIVAFLNTEGGVLVVGQDDEKNILGIEIDKFKNQDDCSKYLKNKIKDYIGITFLETFIKYNFFKVQNKTVLVIECKKLPKDQNAYLKDDFFIRSGPSNEKLTTKDTLDYIKKKTH